MKASYRMYERMRDLKRVRDAQVARETGMRQSVFSDWKAGRSAPKADKVMKLAQYFDVPMENLYER